MKRLKYTAIGFFLFFTWSLIEAVCVMAGYQLETKLAGDETNKIVACLLTLTGEPPAIVSPILPLLGEITPNPNRN